MSEVYRSVRFRILHFFSVSLHDNVMCKCKVKRTQIENEKRNMDGIDRCKSEIAVLMPEDIMND